MGDSDAFLAIQKERTAEIDRRFAKCKDVQAATSATGRAKFQCPEGYEPKRVFVPQAGGGRPYIAAAYTNCRCVPVGDPWRNTGRAGANGEKPAWADEVRFLSYDAGDVASPEKPAPAPLALFPEQYAAPTRIAAEERDAPVALFPEQYVTPTRIAAEDRSAPVAETAADRAADSVRAAMFETFFDECEAFEQDGLRVVSCENEKFRPRRVTYTDSSNAANTFSVCACVPDVPAARLFAQSKSGEAVATRPPWASNLVIDRFPCVEATDGVVCTYGPSVAEAPTPGAASPTTPPQTPADAETNPVLAFFKKPAGPLPTWAWFAIGGGILLLLVIIAVAVSASSTGGGRRSQQLRYLQYAQPSPPPPSPMEMMQPY